jgi:hypothetical protein
MDGCPTSRSNGPGLALLASRPLSAALLVQVVLTCGMLRQEVMV